MKDCLLRRLHFRAYGLTVACVLFLLCGQAAAQCPEPAESARTTAADDQGVSGELDAVLEAFDPPAEADSELQDILQTFDGPGESSGAEPPSNRKTAPGWLHLSGSFGLAGAVNLVSHRAPPEKIDLKGLSGLRTEMDLAADLDFPGSWRARVAGHAFYDWAYHVRGRDNFTDEVLDTYEKEAELGEAWILGNPLPGLDLKFGRQIVVWGKSDNIRVTDILNPLDKREPGMTDIEDLRLPIAMTRMDYGFGDWCLTGLVIHEVRFDKLPVYGSDFYAPPVPLPDEETPSFGFDNQEAGLALNGVFSGWDLSFYGAYVFDDNAQLEPSGNCGVKRRHNRLTMIGGAVNVVCGNWLFKSEAAWLSGLAFAVAPGDEKSRLDILLGVEYSGISDTTISLEAVDRHLFDYCARLGEGPERQKEEDFQWALRISRDYLHNRLKATLLANVFDALGQNGAFERAELSYDLNDHWELTAGLVLYQSGNKPAFQNMGDNDRLFIRLEYSF